MKIPFTTKIIYLLGFALLLNIEASAQSSHSVEVTSNIFTPAELTITAGDEVIWTNTQGSHNVNGNQSVFPSNPESFGNSVGSGWTYSYVFDKPGVYDYQCDPHIGAGMFGKVIVEEAITYEVTINFSAMNPHVGQNLWLRIENEDTNDEIYRSVGQVEQSFSIVVPGLREGDSFAIEFFSDHNNNGYYDAPPVDHAWSISIDEIAGNETIEFSHNTNFTDIEWEHYAILNLSNMTPHVGQEMYFALIEDESGEIIERKSEIVAESFSVSLPEIELGKSYHIDFFSDHNQNGYYDAPSTDHAWRVELANVAGDDTIDFSHNTDFTDIEWKHRLKVDFKGMTPHIGQVLELYLKERSSGLTIDSLTVDQVEEEFNVEFYSIVPGVLYNLDFYADHNGNGAYDPPSTDHAWRIELDEIMGDMEVEFSHNTDFTDIFPETTQVQNSTSKFLRAYPNPASDFLYIESESAIHLVEVYSISGSLLDTFKESGTKRFSLELDSYKSGIYFVSLTDDTSAVEVLQFIKE